MIKMGISDEAIQKELDRNGYKPPQNSAEAEGVLDGPTCLYRHFDAAGVLLYVGISLSAVQRLRAHRCDSHWFDTIAMITVERYETRHKAEIAEDMAISLEKPLHNIRQSSAPTYNIFDPEEKRVETARLIQRMESRWADTRTTRRTKLKAEIEAAGLTSNL